MVKTDYLSNTIGQNKFNNQIATEIMIVSNEVKIAAHKPAASLPRSCLQSRARPKKYCLLVALFTGIINCQILFIADCIGAVTKIELFNFYEGLPSLSLLDSLFATFVEGECFKPINQLACFEMVMKAGKLFSNVRISTFINLLTQDPPTMSHMIEERIFACQQNWFCSRYYEKYQTYICEYRL